MPLPAGFPHVDAAAFIMTYGTSHHALLDRGQLKAGETVLAERLSDDARLVALLPRADDGADRFAAEHASFSYTVSHDLRAPLRVVEGFTRIVQEDYGRALDRIGNDHLERVLAAAARMHAMIDATLAYAAERHLARERTKNSPFAPEYI